jgi:chromosome segregation ATPase
VTEEQGTAMAKKKKEAPTASSIEELTHEYKRLNERKIQAQTQLEEANKQLEALQREADEEFGTSDVGQLKAKLEQMEAENEKRRKEYQELLEGIASDLEKVEQEATEQETESSDDA